MIPITATLHIPVPTTFDGVGQSVTLDGGNARRIISATVGVGVLWRYGSLRSHYLEGLGWLSEVLALDPPGPPSS